MSEESKLKHMNLKARLKSAAAMIPLVLVQLSTHWSRILLQIGIACVCSLEAMEMLSVKDVDGANKLVAQLRLLLIASSVLLPLASNQHILLFILGVLASVSGVLYLSMQVAPLSRTLWSTFRISTCMDGNNGAKVLFLLCWIVLPFSATGFMHDKPHGLDFLVLAILATVVGENGGLLGGTFLGSTPLAPNISPKKTIEGVLCQVLATMTATTLYLSYNRTVYSSFQLLVLGFLVAVAGILGDLQESYIKRCSRVKDAARYLPGWGGLLDRMDGILFAMPVTALYTLIQQPINKM